MARLAVDIGGTFTDVVVEWGEQRATAKVLTTAAPEQGVIDGIGAALDRAGLAPGDLRVLIHGTTLATNAIIERRGARTALVATDGFRDTLAIADESRYDQYDLQIEKPKPLVPRHLRLTVPERIDARGQVLRPLDGTAVDALVPVLERERVESLAIGFLHSYANPDHEQRAAERLARLMPDLAISLSSAVCPEIREYERTSTTVANAYVQPLMAGYLTRLEQALAARGIVCPVYLMTSGGGITTLATAVRFPIRLVESGPAGGAILAATLARACGEDRVLSFDMGGTTAKICLISQGRPQASRSFEVDRAARFLKGSGLPLRIPVIEMVEIGAGGGSIAAVDALRRITVGPESAGSEPGPACYGRGGRHATVTDADLMLGRLDPDAFAGGRLRLDVAAAEAAVARSVGAELALSPALSAFGITEIVDENMANAARVHGVERGKVVADHTLIAFGGAAPLHAVRVAEKLGIDRVLVPVDAGVGSAVGFLRAPIAYEVVRSRYMRLDAFDSAAANAVLAEMRAEARAVVEPGAGGSALVEQAQAFMRYVGQGHEIVVDLPAGPFDAGTAAAIAERFAAAYAALFTRAIPRGAVEILSWSLTVSAPPPAAPAVPPPPSARTAEPVGVRPIHLVGGAEPVAVPVYDRARLLPGMRLAGPAIIAEAATTTVVSAAFDAAVDGAGNILMTRRSSPEA